MSQLDIVICSTPGVFSQRPALAPALLNACVKSAGFKSMSIDLNIEVLNKINRSKKREALERFLRYQDIDPTAVAEIEELIAYCVNRIVDTGAKTVGLCLLTQDNQFFTIWLCYHLRYISPGLRIVIGGSGIKNFVAEQHIGFGEMLRARGLIDDYINGDGERSIVEHLKGNLDYPGINRADWTAIEDLSQLPYPDFSDYDFSQYGETGIPICDSRGCVRTCEFCDIIEHWKRYQYRRADNIFDEMLHQIDLHGIRKFFFYNSLTNGNMKEFNKTLDYICEYNRINPDAQISWDGYFIVRGQHQHPEEFWAKIKKSNGFLQLGIESVVERVRIALGKNFTNEDIDYHLDMAKKYSVPLMILLIIGYPTETREDFEFTKSWFQARKRYIGDPVRQVVMSLAAILPNTQLERRQQEYGIVRGEVATIWLTPATQISTQDRLDYHCELKAMLSKMGAVVDDGNGTTIDVAEQELVR